MQENAEFKGYARVEIMGHQKHTGFVETQAFGPTVLFRVDRPEVPEVEETLAHAEWVDNVRCPAGSVVKRGAIPAATVLLGAGSIYRLIPCDEATAMKDIRESTPRPVFVVKLADAPLITAGDVAREQDPDEDEDDDEIEGAPF